MASRSTPVLHAGAPLPDAGTAPRASAMAGDAAAFAGPRPRVLVFLQAEEITGPGRQLAALAQHLPGAGVDVHIAVLERRARGDLSFAALLAAAGVPHDVVRDRGPLDRSILREAKRLIRETRPDILQTHGYKATALAFLLRATGERRPWVGCYHGWTREDVKARLYHRLDHWMLGRADRIVVMAGPQRAAFATHGDRVRVIHNAVIPLASPDAPADAARVAALLAEARRPLIGVVGRLSPEKGVDLFLRALSLLGRPDSTAPGALIVGDGPERADLETLARDLGLHDQVAFAGTVATMDAVYRGIDLLVIPSRSEGLPNALLEALAADLPVVATTVGAIADVIDRPRTGLLVPPGSPTALAEAIRQALAGLRDQDAARAARRAAVDRFSIERRTRAHADLYRELLPAEGRA